MQSFWIWFNLPAYLKPIVQVEAGRKLLLSYPVDHLIPHRDQGTYPSTEFGAGQAANFDIASVTMRSDDSDLVVSVL